MPLYEFQCANKHKHDRLRPIYRSTDDALCPECGQVARRVMSAFSFAIDFNSIIRKMPAIEAPNDAGYHPKWDKP